MFPVICVLGLGCDIYRGKSILIQPIKPATHFINQDLADDSSHMAKYISRIQYGQCHVMDENTFLPHDPVSKLVEKGGVGNCVISPNEVMGHGVKERTHTRGEVVCFPTCEPSGPQEPQDRWAPTFASMRIMRSFNGHGFLL